MIAVVAVVAVLAVLAVLVIAQFVVHQVAEDRWRTERQFLIEANNHLSVARNTSELAHLERTSQARVTQRQTSNGEPTEVLRPIGL